MAILTSTEVERFVIDKGHPEKLIVGKDDWQKIYEVYRATNRDDFGGVFILVINTKIYSAIDPSPKTVDASKDKIWP